MLSNKAKLMQATTRHETFQRFLPSLKSRLQSVFWTQCTPSSIEFIHLFPQLTFNSTSYFRSRKKVNFAR